MFEYNIVTVYHSYRPFSSSIVLPFCEFWFLQFRQFIQPAKTRHFCLVLTASTVCWPAVTNVVTAPRSTETRPQLGLNLVRHHTSPCCQVNISQPDTVMTYFRSPKQECGGTAVVYTLVVAWFWCFIIKKTNKTLFLINIDTKFIDRVTYLKLFWGPQTRSTLSLLGHVSVEK